MPPFACMELLWGGVSGASFEAWLDEVRGAGFAGVGVHAATLRPFLDDARGFDTLLARRGRVLGAAGR